MFERFWSYTKEHPAIVIGLVALVVIIIWYFSRSSSSAGTPAGIYAETQDPNVVAANASEANTQTNANAALAMAQLSAQTQQALATTQASAATQITSSNNAAAITLAGIQANVTNTFNADALASSQTNSNDALQAALAQTQAQLTVAQASYTSLNLANNDALQAALATTSATQTVDLAQIAAQQAITDKYLNLSSGLAQSALADAYAANAPLSLASPIGDLTLGTTQAVQSPQNTKSHHGGGGGGGGVAPPSSPTPSPTLYTFQLPGGMSFNGGPGMSTSTAGLGALLGAPNQTVWSASGTDAASAATNLLAAHGITNPTPTLLSAFQGYATPMAG